MATEIVDVDDASTWPAEVSRIIERWIQTNEYQDNVAMAEAEDQFRILFRGRLLRAYHFTRLLPSDVEMIRSEGLRMLTLSLTHDRIERALIAGEIAVHEAEVFHRAHVFATGNAAHRENQVCFVLGRSVLKHGRDGTEDLRGTWGGEAMYRAAGGVALRPRLKKLGSASVVTALVDIAEDKHFVTPNLPRTFLRTPLRERGWSDLFYKSAVPPEQIESILRAVDPGYKNLGVRG